MEAEQRVTAGTAAASERGRYTLVCDYGTAWTKVALFGRVDGVGRLITSYAVPTPRKEDGSQNMAEATRAFTSRLFSLTGLAVPSSDDQTRGTAPDVSIDFVPIGSTAPAMDVLLVAPDSASARKLSPLFSDAAYIREVYAGTSAELLTRLAEGKAPRPHVILLVEGRKQTDRAEHKRLAQLFADTGADTRLVPVLHCRPGPAGAVDALMSSVDRVVIAGDLTGRPPQGLSAVRRQLNLAYSRRYLARVGIVSNRQSGESLAFGSTIGAQVIATRYAAGLSQESLLTVDVGSSHIGVCLAAGDELRYAAVSGAGVHQGAAGLYARVGEAALARWLPFAPAAEELRGWAASQSVWAHAAPMDVRSALVEQAFLREAVLFGLQTVSAGTPAPSTVIAGGALARAVTPGAAAALIADAVTAAWPEWSTIKLSVDHANVLPAVGALATTEPLLASEVWHADAPRTAATLLAARGPKAGQPAVRVSIAGGSGSSVDRLVMAGRLHRIALPIESELRVQLAAEKGAVLGGQKKDGRLELDLAASAEYPQPQLLIDTRATNFLKERDDRRIASLRESLVESGALTQRELGEL